MSIHISLWPQPNWAITFCDMMCDRVITGGTMFGDARNAAFSAAVICVGDWLLSALRAFTKSMLAEMPLMYAVRASAALPDLSAASALMNWSCAYVIIGIFALSSKR